MYIKLKCSLQKWHRHETFGKDMNIIKCFLTLVISLQVTEVLLEEMLNVERNIYYITAPSSGAIIVNISNL